MVIEVVTKVSVLEGCETSQVSDVANLTAGEFVSVGEIVVWTGIEAGGA